MPNMKRRMILAVITALLPAAFLAAQTPSAPPPPPPAPKADLPSGEDVLKHFVDATGGAKAYDAVKTQISSGTFSMPAQNITGSIKIYAAAPAKSYSIVDIQNVGKVEDGTDGKIAWEVSGMMGSRIKTGDEASADFRSSAMDLHTNWKKYYKSATVDGTDNLNGKTCYRVVMMPIDGSAETAWFDKDSGLLLKQSATINTPMGNVPTEVSVSDYRKQGELLLPFHITTSMASQQFEIVLDKVELNPDIPDSRFDLPAEIKALQK
jgi:zinc protease